MVANIWWPGAVDRSKRVLGTAVVEAADNSVFHR
jgi:hypothetical protein